MKTEAQGRYGEIAHGFNSQLGNIKSAAQYLLKYVLPAPDGPDLAQLTEKLNAINDSVGEAAELAKRLLALHENNGAAETADAGARHPEPTPVGQRGESPRRNGKALVLEGDAVLRKAIAASLELEGWEVIQAKEALEGMRFLEENRDGVDLVIMDLAEPNADRDFVIRQIKGRSPGTKIILTSSSGMDEGDAAAMDADGFLNKPYARDGLTRAIRELGF
jgi:CheY-like chemotaxis protein